MRVNKNHWGRYIIGVVFLIGLWIALFFILYYFAQYERRAGYFVERGIQEGHFYAIIIFEFILLLLIIILLSRQATVYNKLSKIDIKSKNNIVFSSIATYITWNGKIYGKLFLTKNELSFIPHKKKNKHIYDNSFNINLKSIKNTYNGGFGSKQLYVITEDQTKYLFMTFCKKEWLINIKRILARLK